MFLKFLTHMSNFFLIKYYLLFNPQIFLCIMLTYIKLKFKHLIDDITINFLSSKNFTNMEDIMKKM